MLAYYEALATTREGTTNETKGYIIRWGWMRVSPPNCIHRQGLTGVNWICAVNYSTISTIDAHVSTGRKAKEEASSHQHPTGLRTTSPTTVYSTVLKSLLAYMRYYSSINSNKAVDVTPNIYLGTRVTYIYPFTRDEMSQGNLIEKHECWSLT